jgi:hypothetical protein
MMGPQFLGFASMKWFTYMKKVSWVIEPECYVSIFTSGESGKAF